MRQRRTRFTVHFHDSDEPLVFLGYNAQDARSFYEKRGRQIKSIVKGDYRTKQRAAKAKAQGGFQIDQGALKDAIELLDLKLPVKIRFNARHGNTNGNYRLRDGWHDIMIKSYHTPEQASSTLWHELTHAMQAERAGDKAQWSEVLADQAVYAYKRRPIENEANEMSKTMQDVPLCRPCI